MVRTVSYLLTRLRRWGREHKKLFLSKLLLVACQISLELCCWHLTLLTRSTLGTGDTGMEREGGWGQGSGSNLANVCIFHKILIWEIALNISRCSVRFVWEMLQMCIIIGQLRVNIISSQKWSKSMFSLLILELLYAHAHNCNSCILRYCLIFVTTRHWYHEGNY